MASEKCAPKQPCNNNYFKKQAQIYWYNVNNAKSIQPLKNRLEGELHDFKIS